LATLVRRIEDSLPRSSQDRNHGLGWLVTHVKLLTTVHDNDRSTAGGSNRPNPQGRNSRHCINPEHDSTANLVKRFLLCCPRLEVFLDAAPYGFDELPRSVLTEIGRAPLLYSSSSSSSVARRRRSSVGTGPYTEPEDEDGNDVEVEELLASSEVQQEVYVRESAGERSRIHSLEWGYGSPSISELLSYPPSSAAPKGCRAALGAVTQSVRALRCNALSDPNWVFSMVQGTLRPIPAIQYDRHLMAWASELSLSRRAKSLDDGRPMLWMPRLVLLDMFLSARSHLHWATLVAASTTTITLITSTTSPPSSPPSLSAVSATGGIPAPTTAPSSVNGLPSLTHLTIRTPSSLGTIVGSEAIASLHVFLKAYGPQLKSLDLRVTPGDVEPNARLPDPPVAAGIPMHPGAGNGNGANGNQDPVDGMLNIPLILARCPNLEELVLSARWPSPHSYVTAATTAPVVPPPPNVNNPNGNGNANAPRQNPSPFAIPHHDNIRRIGLRDTTPYVDGFSSTLASRSCPCCRRVYMLSSASELVFGGFMGGTGGSNLGAGPRHDTGTGTVSAQMPYRPRTSASPATSSTSVTQHPFPSTLIESLLNGALLSNAYSLHESLPSSSSSYASRNGRHIRGQHGTGSGVGGVMSHRHCTIDRHFRMMLTGVIPLGEPAPYLPPFVRDGRRDAVADMLAAADGHLGGPGPQGAQEQGGGGGGHGYRQSQTEEDILRRRFGTAPRFPKLETIQLLDSHPGMFSNAKPGRRSRSSSVSGSAKTANPPTPVALALSMISQAQAGAGGVPRSMRHTAASSTSDHDRAIDGSGTTAACGTTCWCIPLEARVEMNFWGAWAARCEARGIKLLDRAGKKIAPVYADFPSSPAVSLSITASTATVHSLPSSSMTHPSVSSHSPSLSPSSSLMSVNRGPSKLENMDLEDELNLSIIRAALLRHSNDRGVVSGLRSSAPIRPFIDTYTAASALLSLTLRSKGPSDMTLREVAQRLLLWFAEHGMINATSEHFVLDLFCRSTGWITDRWSL
jgi:hypothetical protein